MINGYGLRTNTNSQLCNKFVILEMFNYGGIGIDVVFVKTCVIIESAEYMQENELVLFG